MSNGKKHSKQKARQERRVKETQNAKKLEPIFPKSENQRQYFDALSKNLINFVVGPPGAGKSFIALWHGLDALYSGRVNKLIIIRSLTETRLDEKQLGSLPGNAKEKMTPWAGGVFDNMAELIPDFEINKLITSDKLEIFPLSLCRGRTFHDSFVIVEEAQNVSAEGEGMKMILTRIGNNSQMVIAGDLKQNDLDPKKSSGLTDAIRRFYGCEGFGVVVLEPEDIIRHPIINTVLKKYGDDSSKKITLEQILNVKK